MIQFNTKIPNYIFNKIKLNIFFLLTLNIFRLIKIIRNIIYSQYSICKNQQHNFLKINMQRSRIIQQEKIYLQYDADGNTSLTSLTKTDTAKRYRRIHYTHRDIDRKDTKLFIDPYFQIDEAHLASLDPNNGRITLKRLSQIYRMYPKTQKPSFFPPKDYLPPRKLSSSPFLPAFATELGIFPVEHYKSFFITQDIQQNGLYEIVINQNGRFENDIVDDLIPVYEDSFEPIWGMELDQAWQIILLKFWAKRNNGYHNVKTTPAFNFLEYFSDSNWKYFNLQKQAYDFLTFYTGKANVGKFVLKTKNSEVVKSSGLIPGSAGYEMINLVQTTSKINSNQNGQVNPRDRKWVVTIRSTMINKWAGSMSILDKQINKKYYPKEYPMALDRDFMINESDFINLFSSAYIASKRSSQGNSVSDYYLLYVEPNIKKSIYLKFTIDNDSWFDFCVKQFQENKIRPSNKSVLRTEQYNKNQGILDGMRYLKCRFILVKENNNQSMSIFNDPDYLPPAYDTYQVQYLQGYNRGDARFLEAVKGNYILKIKPQSVNKKSTFVVNYASQGVIKMNEYFPDKKQTSLIMRQSMASLIGLMTSYNLNEQLRDEEITFANVFQEIGYGFIGIRSKTKCPYNILLQIDPKQLQLSGYKIKNQFKNIKDVFSILVHPGECTSIVLKKIPANKYEWPPKGVEIFRQKQ